MSTTRDGAPTRAEVCAAALADCFRDDGEILANPIGTLPMIGGRLAKATFGPQLVMTDGEALLVENIMPVGVDAPEKVVGAWNPYRAMFDMVWSGRRLVGRRVSRQRRPLEPRGPAGRCGVDLPPAVVPAFVR